MNDLTYLFLKKKGIGLIFALLVAAIIAALSARAVKDVYHAIQPVVLQQAEGFLPIIIENGKIVEPKDGLVEKTFTADGDSYRVVLNTQVDEFDVSMLDNGIYVSRSNVYSINKNKGEIRIQSLENMPNMAITVASLKQFFASANVYIFPLCFIILFVVFLVVWYLTVALYTLIMFWIFDKLFHCSFGQTFRINLLTYLVLQIAEYLLNSSVKIVMVAVLMLIVNYCANKYLLTDNTRQMS